ncbi:MAG: glycosyltransferase family 2 protein [Bacteroidota bacterium]|nr:glycosyltransferase family 2 protein [Bacteroidota bacterium]
MDLISAVIITHNEERNIARCLSSLKEVADDIVVVDAASTDNTAAIVAQHGARVVNREWTDYSDQKNFANGIALHKYILSMDADESLSPALRKEILDRKKQGLKGAFRFPRITNYCGSWVKHGGWYPDAKIRLFPRDAARWEGSHVHEELKLDPGVKIIDINADLLHYSYHSIGDHLQRIDRYSTLHAQKMFAAGRSAGPIKLYFSPLAKFIQGYFFQLGFLDGTAGFNIARISAKAVRSKYKKLKQLHDRTSVIGNA